MRQMRQTDAARDGDESSAMSLWLLCVSLKQRRACLDAAGFALA
jgi:hypothetical protein